MLDRLHWGELAPEQAAQLHEHVSGCDDCRRRMQLRRKGFAAFDELDPDALRARIEASVRAETARSRRRWYGRLAPVGLAAALVALVLLVVLPRTAPRHGTGTGEIRAKGGFGMRIFRERRGRVESVLSGETFHPGDRLRFMVDLPRAGHLMIVGMEHSGRLYPCYPADGSSTSRRVEAGSGQVLAGAVRLDESVGEEWIFAVLCEGPFSIEKLRAAGDGGIEVPEGCVTRSFKMNKTIP